MIQHVLLTVLGCYLMCYSNISVLSGPYHQSLLSFFYRKKTTYCGLNEYCETFSMQITHLSSSAPTSI